MKYLLTRDVASPDPVAFVDAEDEDEAISKVAFHMGVEIEDIEHDLIEGNLQLIDVTEVATI